MICRAADARKDIQEVIAAYTQANQLLGSDASSVERLKLATTTLSGLRAALHKVNCYPWRSIALPFAHWPIILLGVFGARHLVMLGDESFETGGALWFTDLTVADTTYALPLAAYFLGYSFMEYAYGRQRPDEQQGMSGAPALMGKKALSFIKNLTQLWIICSIPLTYQLPSGLYIAWITGSLYGFTWVSFIRTKSVYSFITGRDPVELEKDKYLFDFVIKDTDKGPDGEGDEESGSTDQTSNSVGKNSSFKKDGSPFGKEKLLSKCDLRTLKPPAINFIRPIGIHEIPPGASRLSSQNMLMYRQFRSDIGTFLATFTPTDEDTLRCMTKVILPISPHPGLRRMVFKYPKSRRTRRYLRAENSCVEEHSGYSSDSESDSVRQISKRPLASTELGAHIVSSPQPLFREWLNRFQWRYINSSSCGSKTTHEHKSNFDSPKSGIVLKKVFLAAKEYSSEYAGFYNDSCKLAFDAARLITMLRRSYPSNSNPVRALDRKKMLTILRLRQNALSNDDQQKLFNEAWEYLQLEKLFEVAEDVEKPSNDVTSFSFKTEGTLSKTQTQHILLLVDLVLRYFEVQGHTVRLKKHREDKPESERSYRGSRYSATTLERRKRMSAFIEGRQEPVKPNVSLLDDPWQKHHYQSSSSEYDRLSKEIPGAIAPADFDTVLGITHGDLEVSKGKREKKKENQLKLMQRMFERILHLYSSGDDNSSDAPTQPPSDELDVDNLNETLVDIAFENEGLIGEAGQDRHHRRLPPTSKRLPQSMENDLTLLAEQEKDNDLARDFLSNVLPGFRSGARSPSVVPVTSSLARRISPSAIGEDRDNKVEVDYLKELKTLLDEDEEEEKHRNGRSVDTDVYSRSK